VELAEEARVSVASSTSAPTIPVNEALEDVDRVPQQVSASEPETQVQEAVSKDKAVTETLPSAVENFGGFVEASVQGEQGEDGHGKTVRGRRRWRGATT
jgi:hypothetical protein